MTDMIDALRKVKQRLYDNMVEGDSPQPAEVVDTVIYAIRDFLEPEVEGRLWDEVLNWYPDYSKDW